MLCVRTGNPIFIDYGMSDFVQESYGYQTKTYFRGCISFCLPEMIKILRSENGTEYVDVYYNDVYCLKKTIETIQNENNLLSGTIKADC